MVYSTDSSKYVVQQKPEIWVTDDISIKFKNTVHINSQVTLDIINTAASILRRLETVQRTTGE